MIDEQIFQGRFNMMHVQNSTLAGGVAIGSVANVILFPYHAVIVGSVAGFVSVLGHVYITVRLSDNCLFFRNFIIF